MSVDLVVNKIECEWTDAFGYHFEEDIETKKLSSAVNIASLVGYIPIIGTIMGICRIYLACDYLSDETSPGDIELYKWQILRGVLELTSLGVLLCGIPDLVATIWRNMPEEDEQAPNPADLKV